MEPLFLLLAVTFFALLGTAAGVATGLTPGLHVNAVAALVLAFQSGLAALGTGLFAWAAPTAQDLVLMASALVVGNVIAHTFLDYVPSILLGAPEAETALSVLPGHRMLLQGRGMEAIRISARGSLVAALLSLALVLPVRAVMGSPVNAYDDLRPYLSLLLLFVAALFVVAEPPRTVHGEPTLVCALPEGLLQQGETPPAVPERRPSEVEAPEEAFLLRGRAGGRRGNRLRVEDDEGGVEVDLRGEPPGPLEGEVALFVAVERPKSRSPGLVQRGWALGVFLLAGGLGTLVLSSPLFSQNWYPVAALQADPRTVAFLPLFTGLFGLPTLLLSVLRPPRVPPQDIHRRPRPLPRRERARGYLSGTLAGAFVAWIPGVTAATATVLSQLFSGREKEGKDEEFILSISCVNTATALFTIVALFTLLRARSGGMAAVQTLAGPLVTPWEPLSSFPWPLALLLLAATVAALLAFLLTPLFGGLFARMANRLPYRALVTAVLVFLVVLILLFSGLVGLAVAGAATWIGLLPPLVGVRRVHLMGALILPLALLL